MKESPLTRRSLLKRTGAAGLAAGLTATTGCTLMFEKPPELRIRNITEEKHTISVHVRSAVTDETILEDSFRIPPGGPHMLVKEVFPSTGDYKVCRTADGVAETCETWTVEESNPEYHVTLAPTTGNGEPYFEMGHYNQ